MHRTRYDLVFRVADLLHVGSGTVRIEEYRDRQDGKWVPREKEVSEIIRDADDHPWIPGSTWKGAFRAIEEIVDKDLFGAAHGDDAEKRGALTFLGSSISDGKTTDIARTSISDGTGASEPNKLFTKAYVQEGARCTATVWIDDRYSGLEVKELEDRFETLVRAFRVKGGRSIGATKAESLGRMELVSATKTPFRLGEQDWIEGVAIEVELPEETPAPGVAVSLLCRGPYITKGGTDGEGGEEDPIKTLPLINSSGDRPRILASSVSGALRARVSWHLALAEAQGRKPERRIRKTSSEARPLDPVQRLFGDEGYRGSLTVAVDDVSPGKSYEQTFVGLDPISQGPSTGKLFSVMAHQGVSFTLRLDAFRALENDEQALFDWLLADLDANGLQLGMMTSKGFGWFNADPTPSPEARNLRPPPRPSSIADIPDNRVTLPYRFVEADLTGVGQPVPEVLDRLRHLHASPLEGGVSGHIDLNWCFESPLLTGPSGDVSAPQKCGDDIVIPGSTLRGAIRNILDIATNARMRNVNDWSDPSIEKRGPYLIGKALEEVWRVGSEHTPKADDSFTPDFVEALFGYVKEGAGTDHEALHQKSRVGFGFARLVSDHDEEAGRIAIKALLAGPNATGVTYDHLGRKRYLVDDADADTVTSRLEATAGGGTDKMPSNLKLLYPIWEAGELIQPLIFESRIAFHNLHPTELGALIWALTLANNADRRHQIGRAKAFGAGRCFVDGINLKTVPNDGSIPGRLKDGLNTPFGFSGQSPVAYINAFVDYLETSGLSKRHGMDELLAITDPGYGAAVRVASAGQSRNINTYQTSGTLGYDANGGFPRRGMSQNEKKAYKANTMAHVADIRGKNGGRLAAVLKKAQP